jgi:hypothetical protein
MLRVYGFMVLKPGTPADGAPPAFSPFWKRGRRGVCPALVEFVHVLGSWRLRLATWLRSSTADSLVAVKGVGVEGEPGIGRFKLGGRVSLDSLGLPEMSQGE